MIIAVWLTDVGILISFGVFIGIGIISSSVDFRILVEEQETLIPTSNKQ